MTAHSEITGTRVLIAPLHLRGFLGGKVPHGIRRERYQWATQALADGFHRREIAQALGLHLSMVHDFIRRGRNQDNGVGQQIRGVGGPAPEVYLWQGRVYHGQKTVAKASGVNPRTVRWHLRTHGDLSRLGAFNPRRSIPVVAGPYHFPSSAALADRLGVHRSTVRRWVREGRTDVILSAIKRAEVAS